MWNLDTSQKQRIITRRILTEVKHYHTAHNKGLEMRILSCKYAKALHECGGFPEVIEAMRLAGEIRVEVLAQGKRLVFPGDSKPVLDADDSALWY